MAVPFLTPSLLHAAPGNPTLLLGPSLGTGALQLWAPSVDYLKQHFQLVAWDLPGHGHSAPSTEPFSMSELATAVLNLMHTLQADGVIDSGSGLLYAGVSVGGAVGLQLAHDAPGTFQALSVICTAAKIGETEGWQQRAELVSRAGTPTMVTGSAQRWFAPGFMERNPVIATNLLHSLQVADRFSYAHVCGALADFDLRKALPTLTDPLLAIAGAHDAVCPPADAERIGTQAPHGRWAVVESAAHLAPAEAPEATAKLLLDFFTPKEQR
ncbi:alpha/beta fold hydrolase [Glutamicibacter sp. PS]|uniref:alpha/beta fold hydrolase n=1 Tax=Glutamicibacter sp. PS TaxID=3075634 RepID=UPI00284E263F|nr:alpha/beta fold hydrolase [Glutamicibacter sp. PS]MDR4534214.1 alpha/beta hydrolase [Glutamicibacter sp. PS]